MARFPVNPWKDYLVPTPGTNAFSFERDDATIAQQAVGCINGLFPITEGDDQAGTSKGASNKRGRHCVISYDIVNGANTGRYITGFADGNSQLAGFADKTFNAPQIGAQTPLFGPANTDLPDGTSQQGSVFVTDGEPRWAGYERKTFASVFVEDSSGGPSFADITAAMSSVSGSTASIYPATTGQNDALYFGHTSQFPVIQVLGLSGSLSGSNVFIVEYSQGSAAWNTLTTVANTFNGGIGGTGGPTAGSINFTPPGDWATDTVNSASRFWVRIRKTDAGTLSHTRVAESAAFFGASATVGFLPTSYVIDDPNAGAPTGAREWGIAQLIGNTNPIIGTEESGAPILVTGQELEVKAAWYDSTQDIQGATGTAITFVSLIDTLTVIAGTHAQPGVDQVRIYVRVSKVPSGSNSVDTNEPFVLIGTIAMGDSFTLTAPSNTSGVDRATYQGLGFPLLDDEEDGDGPHTDIAVGDGVTSGTYLSCARLRNRIYCGGSNRKGFTNRVVYSGIRRPSSFPATNFFDVDPDDGDRIIAVRPLGDVLVIFKERSIHFAAGEPGSGNFLVRRVAEFGCVAKMTAVPIENQVLFLNQRGVMSVNSQGQRSALPLSKPIDPIIRGLTQDATVNACATFDFSQGLYLLAAPGVQAQAVKGAGPGETINDGILAYSLEDGNWAIWLGLYANSIVAMPGNDSSYETWIGDFWGWILRLTDDVRPWQIVSGQTYEGAVTAVASGSVTDTNATMLVSGSLSGDNRQLGLWITMTNGNAIGQSRRVMQIDTGPVMLFEPPFTTTPAVGDSYELAVLPWNIDLGDMDFGQPDQEKSIRDISIHLRQALGDGDAIHPAIDGSDAEDVATNPTFASEAFRTGQRQPDRVDLPALGSTTQRVRLQGKQKSTRPKIRGLTLGLNDSGNPRG